MSLDASLAQLPLEELQLRLAAHAIERPLSSDPGFAKWLEIRDQIKFHRDLKAGEARIGWKDTSTGEVAPPPQVPAFGRSADPKPKTTPAPISVPPPSVKQPETPMGSKLKKDMTEEELEAKRAYQREWHAKKKTKAHAKVAKPKTVNAEVVQIPAPKPAKTQPKISRVDQVPHLADLRLHALQLLPFLESLLPDAAEATRAELDALGEILDLAHSLCSRRVA